MRRKWKNLYHVWNWKVVKDVGELRSSHFTLHTKTNEEEKKLVKAPLKGMHDTRHPQNHQNDTENTM